MKNDCFNSGSQLSFEDPVGEKRKRSFLKEYINKEAGFSSPKEYPAGNVLCKTGDIFRPFLGIVVDCTVNKDNFIKLSFDNCTVLHYDAST